MKDATVYAVAAGITGVATLAGLALIGSSGSTSSGSTSSGSTSTSPLATTEHAAELDAAVAPVGKGVYVRGDGPEHSGSPTDAVHRLRWLDCQWVALLNTWQKPDGNHRHYFRGTKLERYADALAAAGIQVWIWVWPEPAFTAELVADVDGALAYSNVRGVIVNAEKPMYYQPDANTALAAGLRARCDARGKALALVCYGGGPPFHPKFPWSAWASRCDWGQPEIYDMANTLGSAYPARAVENWLRAGFRRVVPLWGASNMHSPEQMAAIIRATPITDAAAGWWDLYWLMKSKARSAVVESVELPDDRFAKV